MKKKIASLLHGNWHRGYVYQADVYQDLMDMVIEFLGECEHHGKVASCDEVSADTIEDLDTWVKKRKELLIRDFYVYCGETR